MKINKTIKIMLIMLLVNIVSYAIVAFVIMNKAWITTVTEWSSGERVIFIIIFLIINFITFILSVCNVPKDK